MARLIRSTSTVLTLLLIVGCRTPDSGIVQQRNHGTVYDTAHEELLDSGKALPLLEQAWRNDVQVYAEPVAIRSWDHGVSTWEVFFATNRAPVDSSQSGHYGPDLLDQPQYGSAAITLQRRRRGADPEQVPRSLFRLVSGSSEPEAKLASLDRVTSLAADDFIAGVADQVARSRQRDVLLFVHGFNVDFDSCLLRTAQIALDLPFNGAVVAYSWPSKGGVRAYGEDESRNAESVASFLAFLQRLRNGLEDDAKVHIVVHSMGNRLVLKALSQWSEADGVSRPIDQLALFAPDVGLNDFREWGPAAVARCRRVSLYTSRHDAALIASKGLHAEQRVGDAFPPVLLEGVETIDCSAIDATSFLGHSYYGSNIDVLADLFMLLKRDHSASQRSHLQQKSSGDGTYWRWTATAPHDLWTWHFDHLAE